MKSGERWSVFTPYTSDSTLPLRTLPLHTLHTPHSTHFTLHTSTPHTSLHTLHSTHFTSLHTLHSTHFTPHTSLHSTHFTPHTSHHTLQACAALTISGMRRSIHIRHAPLSASSRVSRSWSLASSLYITCSFTAVTSARSSISRLVALPMWCGTTLTNLLYSLC